MDTSRLNRGQKAWRTAHHQDPIGEGVTPRDIALARYRHELSTLNQFTERNAQELGAHVQYVTYRIALERLIAALESPQEQRVTRRKMFKRSR